MPTTMHPLISPNNNMISYPHNVAQEEPDHREPHAHQEEEQAAMLGGFGAGKPVDAEVSAMIEGLKGDVEKVGAAGWWGV